MCHYKQAISGYQTEHVFHHFATFHSVDEFLKLCRWAREKGVGVYILGNGSNTLFANRNVQTLILKNALPRELKHLGGDRYEVSSSVQINEVLLYCLQHSLQSFYYLAAVPATVGGALAMNAGRGRQYNLSIYDFVESVTFLTHDTVTIMQRTDMTLGYRSTPFTGVQRQLILSATFHFSPVDLQGNPYNERLEYCKKHYDCSGPNCGSVFKYANTHIMHLLRGVRIHKARYSPTISNWITNHAKDSRAIFRLIAIAKILHKITGQRIETEQIIVH